MSTTTSGVTLSTFPASATCSTVPTFIPIAEAGCGFPVTSNIQAVIDRCCSNAVYGTYNNGCSVFCQAIRGDSQNDNDDILDDLHDCIEDQLDDGNGDDNDTNDNDIFCTNVANLAVSAGAGTATGTATSSTTTSSSAGNSSLASCATTPTSVPVTNAACGWPSTNNLDVIFNACCASGVYGTYNDGCSAFCQPVNGTTTNTDEVLDDLRDCVDDFADEMDDEDFFCNNGAVATASTIPSGLTSGVTATTGSASIASATNGGVGVASGTSGTASGAAATDSGSAAPGRVGEGVSKFGVAFAGLMIASFLTGTLAL